MTNDNMTRAAAEQKAWEEGQPNPQVSIWLDEDRRHVILVLGEEITIRLTADKAARLFQALELDPTIVPTVQRWATEIHAERADATGGARLQHQWERQHHEHEDAAASTLGAGDPETR
jgi:hypothetical protein